MPDKNEKTNTTAKRRSKTMGHFRFINTATVAATAALASLFAIGSTPTMVSAFVELPSPRSLISGTRRGQLRVPEQVPKEEQRSTILGYMSLEQVSEFYQNFPIQSAVLTCSVQASVADTIAQVKPQFDELEQQSSEELSEDLETTRSTDSLVNYPHSLESTIHLHHKNVHKILHEIDWEGRRNLAYVLYGGIFVGLMSHVEYGCVLPHLFGTERTVAVTTEKVCFDNLIAAPTVWLPPAYFIKAWMYGTDDQTAGGILSEGLDKYLADVRENQLLWKYWAIWFPAQAFSFSIIPDHLVVAFMAAVSFFWFILFSTVSSKGDVSDAVDAAN